MGQTESAARTEQAALRDHSEKTDQILQIGTPPQGELVEGVIPRGAAKDNQPDKTQASIMGTGEPEAGRVLDGSLIDSEGLELFFTVREIQEGDGVYNRIIGKSYRDNDRVKLSDLRYLKLLHYNYNHEIQVGELIANAEIADDILGVFKELYGMEYEIESMFLVDNYWPVTQEENAGVLADEKSMHLNNTSCFNYRVVPGKNSLSNHALGRAIDVNPLQNPYVIFDTNGKQILSAEGDPSYIDRSNKRSHMIDHDDPAFLVFSEYGFIWGGDWNSSRDYQHFEKK